MVTDMTATTGMETILKMAMGEVAMAMRGAVMKGVLCLTGLK